MKQLTSYLKFAESKYLFYAILIVNIALVCFTKFYPSMDGPAHLYNSNLLKEIILGNESLSNYYSINTVAIPNWTSHFLITLFQFFFPAWLSEKLFIILYISGMALSFRYLIAKLNKENLYLSVLIFPFIYSFLFHLGFYNFSISFVFYFLAVGYFLQHHSKTSIKNYLVLGLLAIFTYFSNALTFGFSGLTLGAIIIYSTYEDYRSKPILNTNLKQGGKKLLLLLLVTLPSLILAGIFLNTVSFFPSGQTYSTAELVKWINDARPFIVYDYKGEEVSTEQFFHLFLVLAAILFIYKTKTNNTRLRLKSIDVMLVPAIISGTLLFISPNGTGAGMMSDRYCLMFFIFTLVWIVARAVNIKINRILILLILTVHMGLLFKHLNGTIKNLNHKAQNIYNAQNHISENSIVLPVNLSAGWIEPHFSNYLGIEKTMVILENYETSVGWFPLKWKFDNFPHILLGDKNSISGIRWHSNPESNIKKQIDYILLFGNTNKIEDAEWSELKLILNTGFESVYHSPDNYIKLYKLNQHNDQQ